MFIDRLNKILKIKNLTGSTLCKMINMPNANYTNWKKQTPKGETLKQIADVLDVSVDWLLEREGAPEPDESPEYKETPEPDEIQLLKNYRICDDVGKETIISIAELQAKRCKQDEMKPFA